MAEIAGQAAPQAEKQNPIKNKLKQVVERVRNPQKAREERAEKARIAQEEATRIVSVRREITAESRKAKEQRFHPEGESFEDQFAQKITVEAKTGNFEVIDVKPENPKTEVPVVLSSGMSAVPTTDKAIIREMYTGYKGGREVMAIDHTTRQKGEVEKHPDFSGEILKRAQDLIALAQTKGHIDAVGHSLGGMDVIVAASIHPELFRNIVLVDAMGLVGKDSLLALQGRQGGENKKLAELAKVDPQIGEWQKGDEFMKYLKAHPLRAISELRGMTSIQLDGLISNLRENGVKVALVNTTEGELAPLQKVGENVSTLGADGIKQAQVDGFYTVKGQHNDIQIHPELYTQVVNHALDTMHNQRVAEANQGLKSLRPHLSTS